MEGIIFGNYLLNEDQFKTIFREWYAQKKEEFKSALQIRIVDVIDEMVKESTRINSKGKVVPTTYRIKGKYDAAKIYDAWDELSADFFGNGSVTLIATATFGSNSRVWTNNISEKDVVTKGGIGVTKSNLQNIEQSTENTISAVYAAAEIQDILNSHYDNLIKTLSSYRLPSQPDAQALHILFEARQSNLLAGTYEHYTGRTYDDIIFSGQNNSEGKKLDAFMNHVGGYHHELFGLMNSTVNAESLVDSASSFVFDDKFDTIIPNYRYTQSWLLDSLNSASWLSGGDIVVVDDSGQVIYNIQLKSTGKGKVFGVATSELMSLSKKLIELIDSNASPDSLAELMYTHLKTSTSNNFEGIGDFVESGVYQLVKDNLNLK